MVTAPLVAAPFSVRAIGQLKAAGTWRPISTGDIAPGAALAAVVLGGSHALARAVPGRKLKNAAAWVLWASAGLPDGYRSNAVLSTAVAIAARACLGSSEELRAALETFSRSVDQRKQLATPDRGKLKRRLAILTPRELADDEIDLSVLVPADSATLLLRQATSRRRRGWRRPGSWSATPVPSGPSG